jgi:UDP-2,4-diacetamido-2,4,6-trideoxy-beta-L-altropyranose hydrolase
MSLPNKAIGLHSEPYLIIRADVSTHIGTGHLMRCLALAQAWQDAGGHTVFVMCTDAPAIEDRFKLERMEIVHLSAPLGSADDAMQTADLSRRMGASWIVVDGYHFGADYQRFVKEAGLCLLFIDDNGHADRYYADIVLNQNLHAHESLYANREYYTRLLLGPSYALLRREFCKWRGWRREIPEVAHRVLVTLGGGDPDNVTLTVIQALQQVVIDRLEAVVVVGGSNPHYEELQSAARDSRITIGLERDVKNIPELLAWADVAISAAGTTAWELAFMGLPSLLVIQADNQSATAERLNGVGVARNLGRPDSFSPDKVAQELTEILSTDGTQTEMAYHGQRLVDGDGVARVLMHLKNIGLRLRKAREDDCRLLWEWTNDPEVRAVSFSSEPIPWETHEEWFKSRLSDQGCILYIATDSEGNPIGQIRYEFGGDEAIVSISIEKNSRGKSYGSTLLELSAHEVFGASRITTIHAYVKAKNDASIRVFEKAGYRHIGAARIKEQNAVHLILIGSRGHAG